MDGPRNEIPAWREKIRWIPPTLVQDGTGYSWTTRLLRPRTGEEKILGLKETLKAKNRSVIHRMMAEEDLKWALLHGNGRWKEPTKDLVNQVWSAELRTPLSARQKQLGLRERVAGISQAAVVEEMLKEDQRAAKILKATPPSRENGNSS
ncbi:hypothetical protein GCM10023085_12860 [Actinomadura viridis]